MSNKGLPRIALDPLEETVAEVTIRGQVYPVVAITGAAYQGAMAMQAAQQKGEDVDPAILFATARALVPTLPADVNLNIRQSMAVIMAATDQVKEVESLFPNPKGKAGGSHPRASRPRTRSGS